MSKLGGPFWSAVTCRRFGACKRLSPSHFSNERVKAEEESGDKSPHANTGLQPVLAPAPARLVVILGALVCLAMALGGARVPADESPNGNALSLAASMVQASNRRGGACAVVGREDAELSLALAKQGSFVVQGLYANAST
nr:hypothetical protein [Pirellulaceae bacterium]